MKNIFIKSIILTSFTIIFFTTLLVSVHTQAKSVHNEHSLMGSHGMVLISHPKEGLFVSHLPLYKAPHNYQVIYKVQIPESEQVVNLTNENIVTILPERFDLARLISGERFSIKADIYQGHFERGGQLKFTTEITFTKAILIAKVTPTFTQDSAVFYQIPISKKSSIFAHKIQSSPSFDAIGFSENNNRSDNVEMKVCDRADRFNKQLIKKMLIACELVDVKYIETQDFK